MNKKIIILLYLPFCIISQIKAQDAQFSQFYTNSLYLNPAFAGSEMNARVAVNYRNQWTGAQSSFATYSASYDQYVDAVQGGVGFHIMDDVRGDFNTFNISGMYSYKMNLSKKFSFSAGFQTTYSQKKLNWDNLVFPDMIDPSGRNVNTTRELSPNKLKKGFIDFSAGFIGYNKDSYFGFAVHHLTQPLESFSGIENYSNVLSTKFSLQFGTNIEIKNFRFRKGDLYFSPNILFQQQRNFQQINYGIYLHRRQFEAGFWLRQNLKPHFSSLVFLFGYKSDYYKFAYSYDFNISYLSTRIIGAHELSFVIEFERLKPKKKFRAIKCPSF
ncbi:MAG: type IX secretion system membrane protein PorP/SprF [Bacteroidetes bacterium]|nr:type IX secretion system membrane protein PorP/SprF [Bacteroidota bacterium]